MRKGKSIMPEIKRKRTASHLIGIKKTSCATCIFMTLDKNWEKMGVPEELRHICSNEKSFEHNRHVHFKDNCKYNQRNKNWKPVRQYERKK